ncbi:T9SS type A sorting domain-containing protein [Gracilimonas sp.]|uniref:T9SS type A sorting domain-containing protein n=1 Tax=Gracilimonas sp. TaxID=1974203 RepID=UPI0028711068|nr:T9SS type A sorting domain-containing protein [Gracilimonas sp.]
MRNLYYSFLTTIVLLLTFDAAHAQLFEDFEDGSKGSYAASSVTLSTGDWYMEEALLGSLPNDKYNGSQGVRMDRRDGIAANIYMQFDKPNGADEVSFYLAHYGDLAEDAALQVQYSVDSGSSWTNIGDEITAPEELTEYSIPVEIDGDIRFKFIQSSGTDRMNIDDIRITDYIEPADDATIAVTVDGSGAEANATIDFPTTTIDAENSKTLEIKNVGNESLNISEVSVSGAGFTVSNLKDSSLAFNETTELTLTFSPGSEGAFQGSVTIESNAVNSSSFGLNLQGNGIATDEVIPIAEARELSFGTRVTVAGRVTVADEFGGPAFIQDGTAAIAVYWTPLHAAAERGDSVVVTGPLTEFNPVDGPEGDFLTQIAEHEGDDDISYEIIDTEKREIEPAVITISQMNAGGFEAEYVLIQDVSIDHSGAFQGEQNYDISDGSGQGTIRIDGDAESLVGTSAPDGTVNIVGVIDQFFGTYQLKPRDADDLGVEEVTFPGEDISKDQTFEIATWNIEWFGSTSNGPEDEETQFANVKQVIDSVDADLYAFQEISNATQFADLVAELEEYGGVIADFSQSQKTAYLFKRATIDSLDSDVVTGDFFTQQYWANGRYPLMFQFNATVNGKSREMYAFNIHAKAFDDAGSYNQRENAARELKGYLDNLHSSDNVIFIGDYNDTITGSITAGEESPYSEFDSDQDYTIITKNLEEKGFDSQSSGSMIDHITISDELNDEYIPGTERVENTSYIGSYISSTSDHFPIWTRLQFETIVTSNDEELAATPRSFELEQNYPNPFNPSTVISYQLSDNSTVTLQVFDMLGRKVATLVNNERVASGSHEVTFDASNLSSGMYIYQLFTDSGLQLTKKMMLIK